MANKPILPADGATPGLQLHLVDSDDEPLEDGAAGARRLSTASLSRFRSCPQLSSQDTHVQESPNSDDHGLGPELCVSNVHFVQGSPRLRQRFYNRDDPAQAGGRSQTPTPPSTPGSRRSHASLKDAARGPTDLATAATSRAVGRTRMDHALMARAQSTDSPALQNSDEGILRGEDPGSQRECRLSSEFYDEPPEVSLDGRLSATEDGSSIPLGVEPSYPHHHRHQQQNTDHDSMDKCARWLQSLKMTRSTKLKSRSHIQLPPV